MSVAGGLSRQALHGALTALAANDAAVAKTLALVGLPEPRGRAPGAATLARTIVGQQVSVASANAILGRLEALVGADLPTAAFAAASDEALREVGLSRQKAGYLRSLAAEVTSGRLDLSALPADDEAAIAALMAVKGIGRWSAEIYLLFAEGRPDVWPAGDLAVQASVGAMLGLEARPTERALRELGERWRPHRGAMAILAWHRYNSAGVAL